MAGDQGGTSQQARQGCRRRRSQPRRRRCLLKGCGRWFQPRHHWQRYCDEPCAKSARRWAEKRRQRRYRQSAKGRKRRRQASSSYRGRQKQKLAQPTCQAEQRSPDEAPEAPPAEAGQDPRPPDPVETCDRPGCYEHLSSQERHSGRRFCSAPCWRALRTVLQREARWRVRLRAEGHRPRPPHRGRRE